MKDNKIHTREEEELFIQLMQKALTEPQSKFMFIKS